MYRQENLLLDKLVNACMLRLVASIVCTQSLFTRLLRYNNKTPENIMGNTTWPCDDAACMLRREWTKEIGLESHIVGVGEGTRTVGGVTMWPCQIRASDKKFRYFRLDTNKKSPYIIISNVYPYHGNGLQSPVNAFNVRTENTTS